MKGKSPFVGGKDHTTHHLSYLGISDQSVALILAGLGLISALLLLIAISITKWTHLFTILYAVYAITVFLSLFLITKVKPQKAALENEDKKLEKP